MNGYERYALIREVRKMKDSQVALKADIGKSTFSDWKSGRSTPKDEKMKILHNLIKFLSLLTKKVFHSKI